MDDLIKRIALILEVKNLNYSDFADAIGIQRSMVSHIMSGRNNPSLDVVKKVLSTFPDIRTDWLISGKGKMQNEPDLFSTQIPEKANGEEKKENEVSAITKNTQYSLNLDEIESLSEQKERDLTMNDLQKNENVSIKPPEIFADRPHNRPSSIPNFNREGDEIKKSVEKIVIFYTDKTFREYSPED